jgi:hypothetical protein
MAIRQPPVGKAQQAVLKALKLTASNFAEAEQIFERLGLIVTSRREGRKSVPVVRVLSRTDGGLNAAGEGIEWDSGFESVDLTAIAQWI